MGMMKEFKEFAIKGNVMDLAIGVIIGAAFGKIVSSLVDNILMPLVGILLQGMDFSTRTMKIGEAEIKYGMFINAVIYFIIVAFVLFLIIKGINNMRKKEAVTPAAPPAPTNEEKLLMEIRDSLRK
jgi:large conductance mechanosensitive channel